MLIIWKIKNPIEFEPLLRFRPKIKLPTDPSYNHEKLFGSKLEFWAPWRKSALFRKI